MANKKISQLTAATPLVGSELLPIVQSGETVKTTVQDVANLFDPPTQSLQMVTTQGNTTTNTLIANAPNQDPFFIGLQVHDGDVNYHNIRPSSFFLDAEEGDITMAYELPQNGNSCNLLIPAVNGALAVYRTNEGFVLPTTIPSSPLTGSIYFHTASATLRVWNGSWVSIS